MRGRRLFRDRADLVRSLGITLAAASFMSFVGAFGSGEAPPVIRIAYWLGLMAPGWLWGVVVARFFFPQDRWRMNVWVRIVLCAVIVAIPFSGVVAVVTNLAFGSRFTLADAPELVLSVTAVALVMTTINVFAGARAAAETTHASSTPPRFLDRLPLKLRGAQVWAVEAEDHYLRLHTSKGRDLILMRLADAIAELEGIEGAQVHRSWWVARDAIADVRKGDGRATLTLTDGAEVPVSRTHARTLRERGWI